MNIYNKKWIKSVKLVFLLLVLVYSHAIFSQDLVPIPVLTSPVMDLTGTLSESTIQEIQNKILALQKEKGSQIQVLIIPTTQPEAIEQYSIRVGEAWKIGRKGIDDGAILLVAKNDRKLRIEVGYGLEGVIPDAIARRIISEIITPEFKQGNFDEGISVGVNAISKLIQGEALPKPSATDSFDSNRSGRALENLSGFQILLGLIGIAISFIFIFKEKFGYSWLNLGFFFFIAGLLGPFSFLSLLGFSVIGSLIVLLFLVTLIYGGSGGGSNYSGGGGWSSSSGSSSGGGWSGGGGSFGGGGSSGSW